MDRMVLSLVAYLIGAIPFGLLVAKSRGVDIRSQGSGNIGATNVFRVIGKGWGILTFTLDALKGFVPAFFFPMLLRSDASAEWGVLFGSCAILGHSFPVYLRFKGGKGVATGAGMLLGVAPVAVLIGFFCWLLCMVLSRIVSLSSIVAALSVIVSVWVLDRGPVINIVLTVLSLLVIWLHRANIRRLLSGTENRFGKRKEAD